MLFIFKSRLWTFNLVFLCFLQALFCYLSKFYYKPIVIIFLFFCSSSFLQTKMCIQIHLQHFFGCLKSWVIVLKILVACNALVAPRRNSKSAASQILAQKTLTDSNIFSFQYNCRPSFSHVAERH